MSRKRNGPEVWAIKVGRHQENQRGHRKDKITWGKEKAGPAGKTRSGERLVRNKCKK